MNKREQVLQILDQNKIPDYIPAGFFLHFDPSFHRGQSAIEKHLEFFHYTGMDFVKIQFEHAFQPNPNLLKPADWQKIPRLSEDYFVEPLSVIDGLVKAVKRQALVIVTLYSPFMMAGQINGQETITRHILEDPQRAKMGLEIITESMLIFVRACIRLGVDGFYTSTQGAETFRFPDSSPFPECIKPFDLAIMQEVNQRCIFNILHICDYHGGYADYSVFTDYPGHIVNCSLHLGDRRLTGIEASKLFHRPFMGGLERKGIISTGLTTEIEETVLRILSDAPDRFILAADCTVPGETPWDNLRVAIRTAHEYKK